MRKTVYLLILAVGIISCSNDDEILIQDEQTLIGKWIWSSTCGGYMNSCRYPDEDNFESLEFKENSEYIQKINGEVDVIGRYSVTDTIDTGSEELYKIEFEDGAGSYFSLFNNTLRFQQGDSWKKYLRTNK